MKPLAYTMRPKAYSEIVGQDHLVGPNGVLTKMVESHHLFSFILYGEAGCGKTTIAEATCHMLDIESHRFNASTDNKDALRQIINNARFNEDTIVVIDEIHRMKKDIQDFLLPYVENGTITMIGLTTVNPYHSVNQAIRSRCQIYKLNTLTYQDLDVILSRASEKLNLKLTDDVKKYLIEVSGLEIRSLINNFEVLAITAQNKEITLDDAMLAIGKARLNMDKNQDDYYDTLSGLHKSIRGSDVNAALYYLAKLLVADDLQSLCRRLLCVAYEDIGLANPSIGPKVKAACDAARELGMPEARLPLSIVVIEMALSPKSNTGVMAIDSALKDVENGLCGPIPLHLKNLYSFDPKQTPYKYPHNYPNAWVDQQYLPDAIKDKEYINLKDSSKTETAYKERYLLIKKWKINAK